jgi:hypothetical protein
MTRAWIVVVLGLGLGLGGSAGCLPPDGPDRLWINEIEVRDESDGGTRLDIEVHLFDKATHEYFGCASLEEVDKVGVAYQFELFFIRPDRQRLEPHELRGRDVVIEVIEDDHGPCPMRPDIAGGDDPVGTSTPIAGTRLGTTGDLVFGEVVSLRLGLYPDQPAF